jgi:glycine dehydrogenase subunit 1
VRGASGVLPDTLSRVHDLVRPRLDLVVVPTVDGVADLAAVAALVTDETAAIWVETPSFTGAIETGIRTLADAAHAAGAVLVVGTDPVGYGVLTPPADQGADIVCGDIQSLGLHQWYGGAHAGFLAVHDDPRYIGEMPSRLFGLESTDVPGEYGFGDVAYDRTSFAQREEGKEWVGTAAALWGIAAGVHLALMGPQGMAELGETLLARTRYAQLRLASVAGISLTDAAVHLREFVIDVSATGLSAQGIVDALHGDGIDPGVVVGECELLVCVTEVTTQADIDRLADAIASAAASAASVHTASATAALEQNA